jgi:hemoglobin
LSSNDSSATSRPAANAGRDAPRTATSPPGLDRAALARLVDCFYDKVRVDPLIGPVFNAAVHDWTAHKALLTEFWASVVLRAATYRGNPLAMHKPHPIRAEHFDRWLALWRETTRELLDSDSAALMQTYAERIGTGMKLGLGLLDAPRSGRSLGVPIIGAPR